MPDADAEAEAAPLVEDIDLEPAEYVYDVQRHRNGDETAILLTAFGDGWQALAIDVASDGAILETQRIGHADERGRAVGMCEYWLQNHPDGVLGGEPEDSGGLLASLGFGNGGA